MKVNSHTGKISVFNNGSWEEVAGEKVNTVRPENPEEHDTYFDENLNREYVFLNGAWNIFMSPATYKEYKKYIDEAYSLGKEEQRKDCDLHNPEQQQKDIYARAYQAGKAHLGEEKRKDRGLEQKCRNKNNIGFRVACFYTECSITN